MQGKLIEFFGNSFQCPVCGSWRIMTPAELKEDKALCGPPVYSDKEEKSIKNRIAALRKKGREKDAQILEKRFFYGCKTKTLLPIGEPDKKVNIKGLCWLRRARPVTVNGQTYNFTNPPGGIDMRALCEVFDPKALATFNQPDYHNYREAKPGQVIETQEEWDKYFKTGYAIKNEVAERPAYDLPGPTRTELEAERKEKGAQSQAITNKAVEEIGDIKTALSESSVTIKALTEENKSLKDGFEKLASEFNAQVGVNKNMLAEMSDMKETIEKLTSGAPVKTKQD